MSRKRRARDGKCWLGYSMPNVSGDCCHYGDAPCEARDRRHLTEAHPYVTQAIASGVSGVLINAFSVADTIWPPIASSRAGGEMPDQE